MELFMLFNEPDAQIVGIYTTREKAEKRREELLDEHTSKWFFKADWYDPNLVEIVAIKADEDLE